LYLDADYTSLVSNDTTDPFSLYHYTEDRYSIGSRSSIGMKQADVSEKNFSLGTYYTKSSYTYVLAKTYKAGTTYYETCPYDFYYDPTAPDLVIVS
jgi:hypothetical protein